MKTVNEVLTEIKECLHLGLTMKEILLGYAFDLDVSEDTIKEAVQIMKDNEW